MSGRNEAKMDTLKGDKEVLDTRGRGQLRANSERHPAMTHVTGGDFENAAVAAEGDTPGQPWRERRYAIPLGRSHYKRRSTPPELPGRAQPYLSGLFSARDHRAAVWLEAMQEAVKLCGREPLAIRVPFVPGR